MHSARQPIPGEISKQTKLRPFPASVRSRVESRDRPSLQQPQLKFPGCSYYRRRSDNHHRCQQCHLNKGLTFCTRESLCDLCRDWLTEAWAALDKALKQKQKHKVVAAAKRVHDSMDDSIELHAPKDGLHIPPIKRKDDGSIRQKNDSVGKGKTTTSSKASKATDSRPSRSHEKSSKTVSSSVSVADRPSLSDGPSGTGGSDSHRSHNDERGHRDHH